MKADNETLSNGMVDLKSQLLRQLNSQKCYSSGDEDVNTPVNKPQDSRRTEAITSEMFQTPEDDDNNWTDVSNESDQESEHGARLRTLRDNNPVDAILSHEFFDENNVLIPSSKL